MITHKIKEGDLNKFKLFLQQIQIIPTENTCYEDHTAISVQGYLSSGFQKN